MPASAELAHESSVIDVVVVSVRSQRVAFPMANVDEVLPAAGPTALPHAPAVIRGLINLRGEPLPLLDLRTRLELPGRPPEPEDHILVCRAAGRSVGVWVDRAEGIRALATSEIAPLDEQTPAPHIAGVAMVEDGVLLVSDVESFLSMEEASVLDRALAESEGGCGDG